MFTIVVCIWSIVYCFFSLLAVFSIHKSQESNDQPMKKGRQARFLLKFPEYKNLVYLLIAYKVVKIPYSLENKGILRRKVAHL